MLFLSVRLVDLSRSWRTVLSSVKLSLQCGRMHLPICRVCARLWLPVRSLCVDLWCVYVCVCVLARLFFCNASALKAGSVRTVPCVAVVSVVYVVWERFVVAVSYYGEVCANGACCCCLSYVRLRIGESVSTTGSFSVKRLHVLMLFVCVEGLKSAFDGAVPCRGTFCLLSV